MEQRDSRASQQDRKPRPPDQPPPTASKGSEEKPRAGASGRGVVEEGFARLDMLKHRAPVPGGFGPNGGAEGAADGESPRPRANPRGRAGPRYRQGGKRSRPEGSGGAGEGEDHRHLGPLGWQEAGFLLDWSEGAAVAGDVVGNVTNGAVAANAVSTTQA